MKTALVITAWVIVVLMGLFGIASCYVAIWQQSLEWASTSFVSCLLAGFGSVGATALTWEVQP